MIKLTIDDKKLMTRLRKIPQLTENTIRVYTKKVGNDIIKEFKQGIKKDKLGLQRLSELTTKIKGANGTPLYNKGGDGSYSDLLYLRDLPNGYAVSKSTKKHRNSKIRLIDLYNVHEFGAKIPVTDKMRGWFGFNHGIYFKKNKSFITIPARHAVQNAYENVINKIKIEEISNELKYACTLYINKADSIYFDRMKSKWGINEANT